MAGWSRASRRAAIRNGWREATLYLPTRRAGRMARDIFLDVLKTDAAVLPRIVALGDIDEDELAFADESEHSAAPRRSTFRRNSASWNAG